MPGPVSRFYRARASRKKQRRAVRSYKRKGDIKKTRFVRKAPVYEPKLPDRKVVSLKWSESRIMKHNGYAGYDRSALVDINDSSTRSVTNAFTDAMGLFNGSAGLGQPVAVSGLPAEKYVRDAANVAQVNENYTEALKYVGTNFLDLKYPYGRPMNEWQLRCNNPMQPDPHGTIGKTYWSCVSQGEFPSDEDPNLFLSQYSIVPRPVVHRPYMMDNFRLHYDKFCVLAVTFDVAYQALPYDTKTSVAGEARQAILTKAKATGDDETISFWSALPVGLTGDTYDQLNQKAPSGSYLSNMDVLGDYRARSQIEIDSSLTNASDIYTAIANDMSAIVNTIDGWAWGGMINPLSGVSADLSLTGSALQQDANAKKAGTVNFYTRKWDSDPADPTAELAWSEYELPADGSRVIFSPRSLDANYSSVPYFEVDDILVFTVAPIGDEDATERPAQALSTDMPFDGINSTNGNVRHVYVRVSKVLEGNFTYTANRQMGTSSQASGIDDLRHRRGYELTAMHRTQNGKWMDLRPLLIAHIWKTDAFVPYKHYRANFLSDLPAGGNPAQSDAFKGPGYLALRITNEQKMEEPDFHANNWDIARIRETQPKSVRIKTVGWNDRRVHKVRLSWTLQSQKKFRPPGFTKRRRLLPDHHHDVTIPSHEPSRTKIDGDAHLYADTSELAGGLDSTWVGEGGAPTTGLPQDVSTGQIPGYTNTSWHTHSLPSQATTSGPHKEPVPDPRTEQEKVADLYSGRSAYGLPLEGFKETEYEYYNPAVGQCDLMANRDFPIEERPRFFMQYMRAHTDDAFDAKQELLQPPPIRVKVTARYRIAFMKTSEKSEDKSYGGLPDSMDYDGASDPHIRQNPCGHFIPVEDSEGTTTLRKATKIQTVAGQQGDGYSDAGVRLSDSQIEHNAAQQNIATLTALASKAGIRILKYTRGDLICETDRGWMLLPSIRTMSSFDSSFIHDQMGDYYKLAWKRIKNRVLNNIDATVNDRSCYSVFSTLFLPDRVESAVSITNFARAGLHLDTEAWTLFKTYVQNLKKGQSTTSHRLFTTSDPGTDTTEPVTDPSTKPSATKNKTPRTDSVNRIIKRQDGSFFSPTPTSTYQRLLDTYNEVTDTICEAVAPGAARDECAKKTFDALRDNLNDIASLGTTVVGGIASLAAGPGGAAGPGIEEAMVNADAGIENA